MTEIRKGDRVRVTIEGVVVNLDRLGEWVHVEGSHGGHSIHLASLTVPVEVLPPVEDWHVGDVVRNAHREDDQRTWIKLASLGDARVWISCQGNGISHVSRDQLPIRLRLLVRDGQAVPP